LAIDNEKKVKKKLKIWLYGDPAGTVVLFKYGNFQNAFP
jgi:hypothetical protein